MLDFLLAMPFRLSQSIPVMEFRYWSCKSWVSILDIKVLVLVLKLLSLGLEAAESWSHSWIRKSWSWISKSWIQVCRYLTKVPWQLYPSRVKWITNLCWKTKSSRVFKLPVRLADGMAVSPHGLVKIPLDVRCTDNIHRGRNGRNGFRTTRGNIVVSRIDQLRQNVVLIRRADQLVDRKTHLLKCNSNYYDIQLSLFGVHPKTNWQSP